MAAAYSVFANDGVRNRPYFVDRIEDSQRQGHLPAPGRAASGSLQPQTARLVTQVLAANVQGGTGTRAQIDTASRRRARPAPPTTATDVWFVGYTPQLATAIWMGGAGSTNIPMVFNGESAGAVTGGRFPAAHLGCVHELHAGQCADRAVHRPRADARRRATATADRVSRDIHRRRGKVPVSEPEGRANHQHGSFSFLATKWRALIGARFVVDGSVLPTTWVVHQ